MAATTTKIGIINRGLQLLGSQSIASLQENSRGAKAMLRAYDSVLLAELRANTWGFSIKRANLAADPTPPIFGKTQYFPLPGDFLFLASDEVSFDNPSRHDWQIEGTSIVSDEAAPLPIRYVSSNITESNFDVLFAEALAASLAEATCEEITNSNTKLQGIMQRKKDVLGDARKRNSVEKAPTKSPTCSFITVRA